MDLLDVNFFVLHAVDCLVRAKDPEKYKEVQAHDHSHTYPDYINYLPQRFPMSLVASVPLHFEPQEPVQSNQDYVYANDDCAYLENMRDFCVNLHP